MENNFAGNQDQLINYKNYKMFSEAVRVRGNPKIYVPGIMINDIDDYINGIEAILQDGIETDYVHNMRINVYWDNQLECDLSIIDTWFSLFMWKLLLRTDQPIRPKHIFFHEELKKFDIKEFVDRFILTTENKIAYSNFALNIILEDCLWAWSRIEQFAFYLAITINNEDDIDLMQKSPEFYDLLHCSLAGVPIESVKSEGLKLTYQAIDIIKDSEKYLGYEHGLTNSFKASAAISPKQYAEASINIGTKPNGTGGIYPHIIDSSFKTTGINTPLKYFIESATARTAQIINKVNIGESGWFARIIGLNNTDTILNTDPNYECMSNHFLKYNIKSKNHLSMIKNRFFRFNPRGMEYVIDEHDNSLIGKTVYLHSPMKCSSAAHGYGICRRCYGYLYYTNRDINIGKYAAEKLSADLTQIKLSAKHILEAKVIATKWCSEFKDFFEVIDVNTIKLLDFDDSEMDLKKFSIIINPEDVYLVNEEKDTISIEDARNSDDDMFNEYITYFYIRTPTGEEIRISSEDDDYLFITNELNSIIRSKAENADGMVKIPFADLMDMALFCIEINNNEITKIMKDIDSVLNKAAVIRDKTADEVLQSLVDLVIAGGINIDSVHLEVLLMNQIRSTEDILKKPDWDDPNAQYNVITLKQALVNNPSVVVSLLYQDLHKVFYNPLSFSRNAPSFFDMFLCEQPQNYMSNELLTDNVDIKQNDKKIKIATLVKKE